MALTIGTILNGRYKILQILGEGGMGTVYKAEQLGTGAHYAVKELLLNPATSNEERLAAIDRFQKEIELLRTLRHPRIAAFSQHFQDRGNYYFSMEFVPGRSLEKMLETTKGALPEEQVVHWMIQVCEALTYIHSQRPPVVLRDLKPGNIMVMPNNDIQLIDFGIARRFDPAKRTNTENLGTISYASPEHLGSIVSPGQKRSRQNPGRLVQTDSRSDIYSLGATMYHLLTNYEPDPIQTPLPGSILAKNPRLRTIQDRNRMICPIEQVIIKAMQQDSTQRFQSADAMRVALQHCLPGATPINSTIQIAAISGNSTMVVPILGGGVICPRCGLHNRAGAKFCQRDGTPLQAGGRIAPRTARPVPIKARPVQQPQPIPARPANAITAQPITARPSKPPVQATPIKARPVKGIQATPARSPIVATASQGATSIAPTSVQAKPVQQTPPEKEDVKLLRLGMQALTAKNFPEAIAQLEQLQKLGGKEYEAVYNLGRTYRQYALTFREQNRKVYREHLLKATEYFAQATKMRANAFDAYFQLGLTFRELEQYAPASNAFKQARQINPQDPAVYYQLGLVLMDQRSYKEAESVFLDGLKQKPDHTLILVALGRVYLETRKVPLSIETLRKAVQFDGDLWTGWQELGRAHMRAREWQAALSALERARKITGYQTGIYLAMAMCFLKIQDKKEARLLVEEILHHDPKQSDALKLKKQL